jgi:hypothetical protein
MSEIVSATAQLAAPKTVYAFRPWASAQGMGMESAPGPGRPQVWDTADKFTATFSGRGRTPAT